MTMLLIGLVLEIALAVGIGNVLSNAQRHYPVWQPQRVSPELH